MLKGIPFSSYDCSVCLNIFKEKKTRLSIKVIEEMFYDSLVIIFVIFIEFDLVDAVFLNLLKYFLTNHSCPTITVPFIKCKFYEYLLFNY